MKELGPLVELVSACCCPLTSSWFTGPGSAAASGLVQLTGLESLDEHIIVDCWSVRERSGRWLRRVVQLLLLVDLDIYLTAPLSALCHRRIVAMLGFSFSARSIITWSCSWLLTNDVRFPTMDLYWPWKTQRSRVKSTSGLVNYLQLYTTVLNT